MEGISKFDFEFIEWNKGCSDSCVKADFQYKQASRISPVVYFVISLSDAMISPNENSDMRCNYILESYRITSCYPLNIDSKGVNTNVVSRCNC